MYEIELIDEIKAMQQIYEALKDLDIEAKRRVLEWAMDKFVENV